MRLVENSSGDNSLRRQSSDDSLGNPLAVLGIPIMGTSIEETQSTQDPHQITDTKASDRVAAPIASPVAAALRLILDSLNLRYRISVSVFALSRC